MKTYNGSCHCGAVAFTIESNEITQALACNCSYCNRKGTLLGFYPVSQFTLTRGEDMLTDYRFNTKKIAHLFCKVCGVQGFGRGSGPDGSPMVAINVRCLDGVEVDTLTINKYNGKDS